MIAISLMCEGTPLALTPEEPLEPADDAVCGADNERLLWLGFNFDLCQREPGHPGFHWHQSL